MFVSVLFCFSEIVEHHLAWAVAFWAISPVTIVCDLTWELHSVEWLYPCLLAHCSELRVLTAFLPCPHSHVTVTSCGFSRTFPRVVITLPSFPLIEDVWRPHPNYPVQIIISYLLTKTLNFAVSSAHIPNQSCCLKKKKAVLEFIKKGLIQI